MCENERKSYVNKYPTKIIESSDIGPITTNNPGAIYRSRPLSGMINSAMSLRSLRSQSVNLEKFKRKFEYNNDDGQTECINKFQTEWNVAKINSNVCSNSDIDRRKLCRYVRENLFQKSSIIKECGSEILIVSNSDRNKLVVEVDAGTRIKWPRIRVLSPSLITSHISFASKNY
ncbi:unnamed protein product [Rhizophagus irregularis]|nr:unnamed protein product [Rhizophagus irregularis]